MFKAFYDKNKRFKFIHNELSKNKLITYKGKEKLRKTGCFYGDKFNFYIDTSDGVNEDLKIYEYCGRIMEIVEECKGKPFLFFKAAYSPVWSRNIIKIASENNGKVIPFFKWSFNDNFYKYLIPKRKSLTNLKNKCEKEFDVGFAANLKSYDYPKPNKENPLVCWDNYKSFGLKANENTESTGFYTISTRQNMYNLLASSRFSFYHTEKIDYKQYIEKSFTWRVCLNPSGMGEYTSRMFDHTYLGQCVVLRKTSYDFGNSWKEYLPEIDFESPTWEDDLQNILDTHAEWSEKGLEYFEKCWSAKAIAAFLFRQIEEFNY